MDDSELRATALQYAAQMPEAAGNTDNMLREAKKIYEFLSGYAGGLSGGLAGTGGKVYSVSSASDVAN